MQLHNTNGTNQQPTTPTTALQAEHLDENAAISKLEEYKRIVEIQSHRINYLMNMNTGTPSVQFTQREIDSYQLLKNL